MVDIEYWFNWWMFLIVCVLFNSSQNKKAQEEKEKVERIAIAEKDNVNSARNIENKQFADITSKRNLQIKQVSVTSLLIGYEENCFPWNNLDIVLMYFLQKWREDKHTESGKYLRYVIRKESKGITLTYNV